MAANRVEDSADDRAHETKVDTAERRAENGGATMALSEPLAGFGTGVIAIDDALGAKGSANETVCNLGK